MTLRTVLFTSAVSLTLIPTIGHAELMGVTCNFTRICNNFLYCQDIDYELSVTPTQVGWAFSDSDGERPAIRLPDSQDGKGIPAFASYASYHSTMLLTIYSGGAAMLVEHFDEPGFWSYEGSCDVIR